MFDEFIDSVISRLIAGAGLIVAAAIAAVAAAMAVYAFLAPVVGPAWAYVILAVGAAATVAIWSLVRGHHRTHRTRPSVEDRVAALIHDNPSAAFAAGLATGALIKGAPGQAISVWRNRPAKK